MGDTMPLTRTVVGVWARFLAQQKAQMGEFLTQRQAQIDKFFTQRQAQIDQTFVRIDAQMQEMEVRITERLEGRIGDEIQDCERHVGALVRDNTITLRHELEEVVEDSVERSLDFGDNSWEDLKDEIRQACLDELKDDLEGGLVTITLPR
ncbi:hypothetical protein M406DRAFT_354872 [Cryphonectria parasitica EP155]|uniref:Uncharacterized protein n=1 Tax=Cryphonectria parasitica (strain ATCC 38755 / EP155) TaxID=660469 RepID=A0A9P4Y896_CRYP1|nr:uncharacterized protein M406DRAFT_354872 [Cryphonectria parasitica EP155]KAF3768280.1 hypothetical protein M406DRAFT_354872 [Cryphonectria parasitica EP155]